jgi:hypothetical protein
MKMQIALFLDFDGVLHHYFPLQDKSDEENQRFYYLSNFESLIREIKEDLDIVIVISSSWRKTRALDELKSLFSVDIQSLIVDKTPVINEESRELEVTTWINQNNFTGSYLILDDCDFFFKDKSNLIHCYDKFNEREITLFKNKIKEFKQMFEIR